MTENNRIVIMKELERKGIRCITKYNIGKDTDFIFVENTNKEILNTLKISPTKEKNILNKDYITFLYKGCRVVHLKKYSSVIDEPKIIRQAFESVGFTTKASKSKNHVILLSLFSQRSNVHEFIGNFLSGTTKKIKRSISSLGVWQKGNVYIYVKPSDRGSAGIGNEKEIVSCINKFVKVCGGSSNVIFEDGKKTLTCYGVHKCEHVGSSGDKADVVVYGYETSTPQTNKASIILRGNQESSSSPKNYLISIKQDNFEFWESSDSRVKKYKDKIAKILEMAENEEKGLTLTADDSEVPIYTISKNVVWKPRAADMKSICFGDNNNKVDAIVKRTFTSSDFVVDEDELRIRCTSVMTEMSDFAQEPEDKPVFILRNDKSRNSKVIGIKGLRVNVVTESRISKNCVLI